jgi:hypothetical protein
MKKRITLDQEELALLHTILLNGGTLLDNKSDEEKKSYRSLFEKTKKAYISNEL